MISYPPTICLSNLTKAVYGDNSGVNICVGVWSHVGVCVWGGKGVGLCSCLLYCRKLVLQALTWWRIEFLNVAWCWSWICLTPCPAQAAARPSQMHGLWLCLKSQEALFPSCFWQRSSLHHLEHLKENLQTAKKHGSCRIQRLQFTSASQNGMCALPECFPQLHICLDHSSKNPRVVTMPLFTARVQRLILFNLLFPSRNVHGLLKSWVGKKHALF